MFHKGVEKEDLETVNARLVEWNKSVFREMKDQVSESSHASFPMAESELLRPAILDFLAEAKWQDLYQEFRSSPLNLKEYKHALLVWLDGEACNMRLAVGQDTEGVEYGDAAELSIALQPGLNVVELRPKSFRVLRGEPDLAQVKKASFGGQASNAKLKVYLIGKGGKQLFPSLVTEANDTQPVQSSVKQFLRKVKHKLVK